MDLDLQSCARLVNSISPPDSHLLGKKLHLLFFKRGVLSSVLTVANRFLQMYVRCGQISDARKLFDEMTERNHFSWNTLLEGYLKCGMLSESLRLFSQMDQKNDFSWNVVITGLVKAGELEAARRLSYEMPRKNAVAWNCLIDGFSRNGLSGVALRLFRDFSYSNDREVSGIDSFILTTALRTCADLGSIRLGKQIHARIVVHKLEVDSTLASSLVNIGNYSRLLNYGRCFECVQQRTKCRELSARACCDLVEDAKCIFESMPHKSLISWNAMIVGFCQNGLPREAIDIFNKMNKMDVRMDRFSYTSTISACSSISSLELGEQVFARAIITGVDSDQVFSTAVLDLYCKCGLVKQARKIFDQIPVPDEALWNSMLMGYATNGYGTESLNLLCEMRQAGVLPTDITFTGVLSACDHCGLLEEGKKWFLAMKNDYHIDPGIEHYSCMVDLYVRAGCLEEAVNITQTMPFEADASMWSSILRGCVAVGNEILGKVVAKKIIELDPANSGALVQLSNMYATSGKWEESAMVWNLMQEMGVHKIPGQSW
ncbi:unnamed protein product [Cuscuta campestris]|uniref:Pentacotripeptide-repeat region of PRORP domain-containing protein n=1 Tax=Cuscuta campestris TaxID=132261 RepID=A0A484LDQ2_9ASTE|nr:unnamed protein product [Cuscuta campestris]